MTFSLFALLLFIGGSITTFCSDSSEDQNDRFVIPDIILVRPSSPISYESLMPATPSPSFKRPDYYISKDDIRTLDGSRRLNDEVLNYYLQLKASESPGVYVFNTHFYTALKAYGFEHVKKWTKNVNIFAFRIVLFPIYHREIEHWSLVVADMQSKTLYCFDSIDEDNPLVIKALKNYLSDEHDARHAISIEFQQVKFAGEIPKQTNDYDCGVFVLKYAVEIIAAADSLEHLEFSFGQKDIQNIRKAIKNKIENASKTTEQPNVAVMSETRTTTTTTTNTNTAHERDLEEDYDTEDGSADDQREDVVMGDDKKNSKGTSNLSVLEPEFNFLDDTVEHIVDEVEKADFPKHQEIIDLDSTDDCSEDDTPEPLLKKRRLNES